MRPTHRERGRPRAWLLWTVILVFAAMSSTARADLEPDAEKEKIDYGFMVSSYYMFNAHRVSGPYNDAEYPYADSHGFGLVFAGAGIRYETQKWGVMLQLRWGENVGRLTEIPPISRAFVTWIVVPHNRVRLTRPKRNRFRLAPLGKSRPQPMV